MSLRASQISLASITAVIAFAVVSTFQSRSADACGYFAPPSPSVPVVQAGERIVFDLNDGYVTAHIQVQASGKAESFGWLLPMPSVPELGIGTDELFTAVSRRTQPLYYVNYTYNGNCLFDPRRFGGTADSAGSGGDGDGDGEGNGPPTVLVSETIIGPYEAAIVRADEKQPMLDWLTDNGYFIPAGTEELVDYYIRDGAFMLALKLRKGSKISDLQPVVVKYKSDLPMIPIILTAVAAQADMGVHVWVLGNSRAIPRNFNHTVLNDARIDWQGAGQNYAEVVTHAVDEASGHHSFVTEYAGTTDVMSDRLFPEGRFGDTSELAAIFDPLTFISYLNNNGYLNFIPQSYQTDQIFYTRETLAVLDHHLPLPPGLAALNISASEYYANIVFYLTDYRDQHPEVFTDADLDFVPSELAADLAERVVEPTRIAQALFDDNPIMTRMFTTLSPYEMVKDPVFSFNADLPMVSNVHVAEVTYYCGLGGFDETQTPMRLVTERGFVLNYPEGTGVDPFSEIEMPWAFQTQILREQGEPVIVDDNRSKIISALNIFDGGGCTITGKSSRTGGSMLVLLLGALWAGNRRRRVRR